MDNHEASEVSDIIVVHTKSCPRLHSILKQRTLSESSDDGRRLSFSADRLISTASEDASESDGGFDSQLSSSVSSGISVRPVLKKSVSFSDRIDHAVFQVNQSVSAMHAILKNRRRRARKRDQYFQQKAVSSNGTRRRCRSSGSISMEDSGDEHHVVVSGKGGSVLKMSDQSSVSGVRLQQGSIMKNGAMVEKSNSQSDLDDQQEDFNEAAEGAQAFSENNCRMDWKNVADGIAPCGTSDAVELIGKSMKAAVDHEVVVSNSVELKSDVISNYSGIVSAKMTQSGRNAINSDGSFRTNLPNGFYHRDYETLNKHDTPGCGEFDVLSEDHPFGNVSRVNMVNENDSIGSVCSMENPATGGC